MSLYNGPARGGNRGGKDQFNWDSVKSDKDREFYLGHSVKATTGRWQKGKDVFWYTREKQEEEAAKARLEMQAIKQREEDLMNEALGLKPKMLKQNVKPKLNSQDMAKLLGKTDSEEQGQPDPLQDPDAVKGLGYAPNMMTVGASAGHDVLRGIGVDGDGAARAEQPSQAQGLPGPPPRLSAEDLQRLLKKQKKAAHKARKEVKKAKKDAKKHKKKDAETSQHRQTQRPLQANGRDHIAAASDSSMTSGSDPSPRHHGDHSQSPAGVTERSGQQDRDAQDRYAREPDSTRHRRYDTSSQRHGTRHRHDSPSPERVRHFEADAPKTRCAARHAHNHGENRSSRRHSRASLSTSPPRRRRRTSIPAH